MTFATEDDISNIEIATRDQANCKAWFDERGKRLTASNFGIVCKARQTTDHRKLANRLLSSNQFVSRSVSHGRQYESVAVEMFEQQTELVAMKCGLFVCKLLPYLAASPDRVVDEDIILEVKCPFSSRNKPIDPVTVPYLKYCDNEIVLDCNHNYYYQVQGQLLCTERKLCYFCVYTIADFIVLKIHRDDEFIAKMLNSLTDFYEKHFRNAILDKLLYREYKLYFQ